MIDLDEFTRDLQNHKNTTGLKPSSSSHSLKNPITSKPDQLSIDLQNHQNTTGLDPARSVRSLNNPITSKPDQLSIDLQNHQNTTGLKPNNSAFSLNHNPAQPDQVSRDLQSNVNTSPMKNPTIAGKRAFNKAEDVAVKPRRAASKAHHIGLIDEQGRVVATSSSLASLDKIAQNYANITQKPAKLKSQLLFSGEQLSTHTAFPHDPNEFDSFGLSKSSKQTAHPIFNIKALYKDNPDEPVYYEHDDHLFDIHSDRWIAKSNAASNFKSRELHPSDIYVMASRDLLTDDDIDALSKSNFNTSKVKLIKSTIDDLKQAITKHAREYKKQDYNFDF